MCIVNSDIPEVLQSSCFTIVTSDKCCKDRGVSQMVIEVVDKSGMHRVHQVEVIVHPSEQDGFRD